MRLPDFPHLERQFFRPLSQPRRFLGVLVSCLGLRLAFEIAALEADGSTCC